MIGKVGSLKIGIDDRPFFIAGPCVIESEKHCLKMAERLAGIRRALESASDFQSLVRQGESHFRGTPIRGPGMEEGLRILEKARGDQRASDTERCP